MRKKFYSKRDPFMGIIIIALCLLFTYLLLSSILSSNVKLSTWIPTIIIMILVPLGLLWIYFNTHYIINGKNLRYVSGPLRGNIDITKIRKVVSNKTKWVGIKPATGRNGIVIHHKKYDEIYISPARDDAFIEALKEINTDIEVIENEDIV